MPVPAPPAGTPKPSLLKRLFGRGELDPSGDLNKRRISILQPDSYVAEQFRALRGRIDAIAAGHAHWAPQDIGLFLEPHIEQGPTLETAGIWYAGRMVADARAILEES